MRSDTIQDIQPRILIVDDEPVNLELLYRVFEEQAYVVRAADGNTAIEHLKKDTFDVVLLDIMMPEMDGLEVLKWMRETDALRDLPVILLSALSTSREVVHGIRMGANDYIPKPIEIDVIRARVNTQIKLKRAADERTHMISNLESANALRSRLMQVASHDLKNPLNNLRLVHRLLGRQLETDEKVQPLLDTMRATLDAMGDVIEEILDAQALGEFGRAPVLKPLNAGRAIREVIQQYLPAASAKDITIDASAVSGWVMADQARFRQVIANLLSNAIKFSPNGKKVTLASQDDGTTWELAVTDEGPGIPRDEIPRLFAPFTQLTPRPTAGESSTGLGLWIVKEMMRVQKGKVGVEVPPEGGSTFWIQLPLTPPLAGDTQPLEAIATADTQEVEKVPDDTDITQDVTDLAREAMARAGATAQQAYSASEDDDEASAPHHNSAGSGLLAPPSEATP